MIFCFNINLGNKKKFPELTDEIPELLQQENKYIEICPYVGHNLKKPEMY